MNRTTRKTLYYRFNKILPIAAIKTAAGVTEYPIETQGNQTFDLRALLSGILKSFITQNRMPASFNSDYFLEELFRTVGEFYLPINPRRIMSAPKWSGSPQSVTVSYQASLTFIDGANTRNEQKVFSGNNPAGVEPTAVYIYTDWFEFVGDVCKRLARALSRAAELVNAYTAIPAVNEQFTDETVITPDLTSTSQEQFNPIASVSPANKVTTTNTQKGTQKSVSKRASGVSAREQAEIIRNLPNIFTDFITEIKELLVDPRAIQDMCDWQLEYGAYVDKEEI